MLEWLLSRGCNNLTQLRAIECDSFGETRDRPAEHRVRLRSEPTGRRISANLARRPAPLRRPHGVFDGCRLNGAVCPTISVISDPKFCKHFRGYHVVQSS